MTPAIHLRSRCQHYGQPFLRKLSGPPTHPSGLLFSLDPLGPAVNCEELEIAAGVDDGSEYGPYVADGRDWVHEWIDKVGEGKQWVVRSDSAKEQEWWVAFWLTNRQRDD